MFSFEYKDWQIVCSKIFSEKPGRKKYYLQWYPFVMMSYKDKYYISSEYFFYKYVKSGLFLYYSKTWLVCNNYILKGDGSFRNASLVSPLLYLASLTIGKQISKYFISNRPDSIIIHYAGNYNKNLFFYEKEYDIFCNTISALSKQFLYFIKTDIKDFFSNIDINKLFKIIKDRINEISQKDIMIYKELLIFLGQGEFPLIENSLVSSYLSTIVYLENTDINLYGYLKNKILNLTDFIMIRYVDDLYILFNSNVSFKEITPDVNRIIYYYSSELKKMNLSLNRMKTVFKNSEKLNEELKKSQYKEKYSGKNNKLTNYIATKILPKFIDQIEISLNKYKLNIDTYFDIVNKIFKIKAPETNAQELYNRITYTNHSIFTNKKIINKLIELIKNDYTFLKLDPKRLVIILLNTNDSVLIKLFLAKLFEANRCKTWDVYDTTIAVNYLIQRGFTHDDLLNILSKEENDIHEYYKLYCKYSFVNIYKEAPSNFINIFYDKYYHKDDHKLFFLFFLYKIELYKNNLLTSFAYYKNFFDRITAHLAYFMLNRHTNKKPNYKNYYRANDLIKIYSDIANSASIINTAHKLRNSNPISHSSAELVDNNNVNISIIETINNLSMLIENKIMRIYESSIDYKRENELQQGTQP